MFVSIDTRRPVTMRRRGQLLVLLLVPVLTVLACGPAGADPLPPTSTGDLFLSDFNGDQIVRVAADLTGFQYGSHADLEEPRGITLADDGNLYVSSEATDRVLVFDRSLNYLRQFTHPDLDGPTGSALSPSGELYVSSFDSGQVVVFTLDGTYQRTIAHIALDGPNCVAFDDQGHFLVACGLNDRVVEFDDSDVYVGDFTGGGLDSPMSIAFAPDGHFFVSGGLSNNVVEFDANRAVVQVHTAPGFNFVQSLAFDDAGRILASNFSSANLVILDPDSGPVATIPVPGIGNGRGLSFDRVPPSVACRKGTVDMMNGMPRSIFLINGERGDEERRLDVSASSPVTFSVEDYPRARPQIPYVTFARAGANQDQHLTPFPRGAGPTCFATPVTGGAALTVFNILGEEELLGVPKVPGTPPGPGPILQIPGLNAGAVGRVVTLFTVVPDPAARQGGIGISNSIVVTVVP